MANKKKATRKKKATVDPEYLYLVVDDEAYNEDRLTLCKSVTEVEEVLLDKAQDDAMWNDGGEATVDEWNERGLKVYSVLNKPTSPALEIDKKFKVFL